MVVVAVDVDDYHDKVVEGDDENFLHWPSSQADWWKLENVWQFILYSIHIGVIYQVTHVSLVTREILSLSVSLVTPVNLVNQVSMESILWTQFVWSQ